MCVHCLQVIDVASAQQSSVQNETMGAYAFSNETSDNKNQKVRIYVYIHGYSPSASIVL